MSYFRPWESSTADNSQAHQQGNETNSLTTNKHGFSHNALLDAYLNAKHIQVVARLADLMSFEGCVAQQLHRYYIESLTQLQITSSSSRSSQQPPSHQQEMPQASKKQCEDLFFIIEIRCEALEEHMRECIRNGITRPLCGTTDGNYCESSGSKKSQRKKAKPNPKVRRQLFPAK